ncbi:tetratricopeptide repeat protein [Leadbetterella byssophila]|jgi:tetratricopeptide (TPR) repeat protein|uniref:Tetratricopeptide TPR_1 repeat-containing protein n=1 Tax=Leadbetterella byssophila (strain DSM 17132 / JCM 16389 / KACC 11308 / NBRC 106382 / 4M15) TaxID=649349 RepID=E4RQN0_LEAB4|nr:tetratricopeptide repeat protein [Leadbetterella byssophila]ADQ17486.1 Tetratricopeptide TPR_1 repeat-containing protein [Leadbetterella byssophila DSM 17132]
MNQEESFDEYNEISAEEVAKRFEALLKRKESPAFSEEVFESLTEYYLVKGNLEMALKACNFGLKLYPNSLDMMLNKVQVLINRLNLYEATEILDHASIFFPSDMEIQYFRGVINIYSGEHEKALEIFEEILPISEEKENIYFQMGMAQSGLGLMEDSIISFQKAIEENSKSDIVYTELVFSYELASALDAGVAYFKGLIDKDPYNHLAWFALGQCYNNQALFSEAKDAFEYVTAIKDKFAQGWYNLGLSQMSLEDYEGAKESFKSAFALEEPSADMWVQLGNAHERLEEYLDAYKAYRTASNLDEYNDEAWFGMSSVLYEQERYAEAIHFVKKAIKLNEGNSDYWLLLADNESKFGNIISAEEAYRTAAELNPIDADIWLNWSLLHFEVQDYKRAFDIVTDGLEDLPEEADLYYRATVYLLYDGSLNLANKYLREALVLDYDKHIQLYDFFSNLNTLKTLQRLIEQYRP